MLKYALQSMGLSAQAEGMPSAPRTASPTFSVSSPAEAPKKQIVMHSPEYYQACAIGGAYACGLTHTAVTPFDVVKCNIQVDPKKYGGIVNGFKVVAKEQGPPGIVRGWFPTLLGYSAQGAFKFGLYEYFKKTYTNLVGEDIAKKYQNVVFLAGSASAEFFADIALCPFEAVKVKVQTSPGYARGLIDGFPKFVANEGVTSLFRGVVPLWARQIPYTMVKFGAFENTVGLLYKYVVPKPKAECSKPEQVAVSFGAGYIAGVLCAVISQPADNLVSKMNAQKGLPASAIIKEMGWWALFTRGLGLRIFMVGTLTGLQWGIYDAYKVSVGLPTTGATQEKK